MENESLIHCLEYCTSYFESKDHGQIRDLWFIIGLQGPGIFYDDLKSIYCSQEHAGGQN